MSDVSSDETITQLRVLHEEVDRDANRIADHHRSQLKCGLGCADCCQDDLSVFEIEADRIRRQHAHLLATGKPHAKGSCAFLSAEGACRIYPSRPYVCRTQGLPLLWLEESPAGDIVQRRGICHLNVLQPSLAEVSDDHCFLLGPYEDRLAVLQQAYAGSLRRVSLRSLFQRA